MNPSATAGGGPLRRLVDVLLAQLRQGITPDQLALSLALGIVLGLFPILGATSALCALAAFRLRLNQPAIQLVNWLCAPLQLLLLLPFYHAGTCFGAPRLSLSVVQLVARFKGEGLLGFVADFGLVALGGIAVWLLLAPPVAALLYFLLRPLLRGLAQQRVPRRP